MTGRRNLMGTPVYKTPTNTPQRSEVKITYLSPREIAAKYGSKKPIPKIESKVIIELVNKISVAIVTEPIEKAKIMSIVEMTADLYLRGFSYHRAFRKAKEWREGKI